MKTIKNRKIKYNEEKYINSNYVVDGKAIIPVLLENTDDLFMKHDFKKIETSDDVCKYIEEIAYMVPMDMDIVIEIHCPKVSDEKQEKMIKALRNNYGMEIDDVDYDISKINIIIEKTILPLISFEAYPIVELYTIKTFYFFNLLVVSL